MYLEIISGVRRMPRHNHLVAFIFLLAATAAASPSAAAQPAAAAGASKADRERTAKRACLTGDAAGGVAILTDLYIESNDPTYLFNQGRCFEQNRRYEDAIGRFREYLVKTKGMSREDRAEAEQHIADCQSYLSTKPAEPAPPATTAPVAPPPATPPPGAVQTDPAPELTVNTTPAASPAGSTLRAAGVVAGAVGVAGLVAGLVLNLKANGMSGDLENQYDPSVDSTRKSYKVAGWIAYGAGAACLASGVLLYSVGWSRGRHAGSVALVPTVGPAFAGTALIGAF
jgi:hypothetical protein